MNFIRALFFGVALFFTIIALRYPIYDAKAGPDVSLVILCLVAGAIFTLALSVRE